MNDINTVIIVVIVLILIIYFICPTPTQSTENFDIADRLECVEPDEWDPYMQTCNISNEHYMCNQSGDRWDTTMAPAQCFKSLAHQTCDENGDLWIGQPGCARTAAHISCLKNCSKDGACQNYITNSQSY